MAEECGLCRLPNITLPTWTLCGHCFCDACIRRHISRVPKCPVCDEVVLMADLATTPNTAHLSSALDPVDPLPALPNISSSTAHAPEVAPFGLPPDGPPPYSSTPQGNRVYSRDRKLVRDLGRFESFFFCKSHCHGVISKISNKSFS